VIGGGEEDERCDGDGGGDEGMGFCCSGRHYGVVMWEDVMSWFRWVRYGALIF
jgi:hypothetical protein